MAVSRTGGRVLLIDPADRVLLIHERIDDGSAQWITPGGGAEPGETPLQAAIREVREETGISVALPPDAPQVHEQRRIWRSTDVVYEQVDHFFTAHVGADVAVAPTALTDTEQLTILGWRWWSQAELRASDEVFVPADLADVLGRVTASPRTSGRVLLVDDHDRVLLIENRVDVDTQATHWITPGGGAEPDETPAEAAVRELYEEVGVRAALDGAAAVHVDDEVFTFNGAWYAQTNHYFLVKVASNTRLRVAGVDEIEQSVLVGERWWSLAELRESDAVIYPQGLADLLERLLSSAGAASA
jgi:8-oxo-dGTP pyrophosphatase MutT (NUDIX family)